MDWRLRLIGTLLIGVPDWGFADYNGGEDC